MLRNLNFIIQIEYFLYFYCTGIYIKYLCDGSFDLKPMSSKKEEIEKNADQQKKQVEEVTSTVKDTANKINTELIEYQEGTKKIFEDNVDSVNQFQERFIKTSKEISNSYIELQKNILNIYQSGYSQVLNNLYKTYWNNFMIPERYGDVYNKFNKNISDSITTSTKIVNDIVIGNVEIINRSIEVTQKFYNDSIQNYFNYVRKIEKSYNN